MEFLTETVKFNDILVYIIGVYESHCCESKGKFDPIGFELKFHRFGQDRIELSSFFLRSVRIAFFQTFLIIGAIFSFSFFFDYILLMCRSLRLQRKCNNPVITKSYLVAHYIVPL